MIYVVLIYLAVISLIAVTLTVSDKRRAVRHRYRISEFTLMLFSALGGGVAMLLTMLLIHHKTRHVKFMVGIPVIIILQLTAAFVIRQVFYG